ncbi:MAG: cadherin-like beta sandwich domain-containing protein [Lachnospiraceae bacterium]|nr:cadherin-like beta sandwich domain-containing protein [Lachnospiraceae bacterium]
MKKKIAILLAIVLVLGISVVGITSKNTSYAKTAEMRLEVPDSIKKENVFTVKVVLESDVQLYSIDAYLTYDASMLEFIPDTNYVTGANGLLELKDVYQEETKKATYELTFKALETGDAEVALTDVYLIDYADLDYITVAPTAKQFTIGINRQVAKDARLSELIVAPGDFTEEFDPDTLEYEMHVGLDVTQVGVSAIPMDEGSVVGLDMPDTLKLGKNVIKVTVTALSGNVNEYIVTVIREEIQKSSEEISVDDTNASEEGTEEAEETTNEEAVTSESTTEGSANEEAVTSESTTEGSTNEETVTSESTTEGSTNEEAVTSESTTEGFTNEESVTE